MSFWIYRKNKEGKREVYSVTIPFELLMIAFGLLAAIFIPRYIINPGHALKDSFLIVVVGFVLFAISKVSLYRKGIWNSWGARLMDKPYRFLYRFGYLLMALGIFGSLIF